MTTAAKVVATRTEVVVAGQGVGVGGHVVTGVVMDKVLVAAEVMVVKVLAIVVNVGTVSSKVRL